jgi:hypothetical protein
VYWNLFEEAKVTLKKAKEREAAEAMLRIMEAQNGQAYCPC